MAEEYTEPTNEQLASFLAVYARQFPAFSNLAISPAILEHIFETQPDYRELALRKHREFQAQIVEMTELLRKGMLQCEHILRSGKRCPNFNVPGTFYCTFHQGE